MVTVFGQCHLAAGIKTHEIGLQKLIAISYHQSGWAKRY
jgi:hypothetical protein